MSDTNLVGNRECRWYVAQERRALRVCSTGWYDSATHSTAKDRYSPCRRSPARIGRTLGPARQPSQRDRTEVSNRVGGTRPDRIGMFGSEIAFLKPTPMGFEIAPCPSVAVGKHNPGPAWLSDKKTSIWNSQVSLQKEVRPWRMKLQDST